MKRSILLSIVMSLGLAGTANAKKKLVKKSVANKTKIEKALTSSVNSNIETRAPSAESVSEPASASVVLPTSTTTLEGKTPAELKAFTGSLVMDATNKVSSVERGTHKSFLEAGYNINATQKISVRQYFGGNVILSGAEASANESNGMTFNRSYNALIFKQKSDKGILGSDAVTPSFWLLGPGGDATAIEMKLRGSVRAEVQPSWNLTPKIAVSYLLSPRFSVYETNDNPYIDPDKITHAENTLTLIHEADISYNFTDNLSAFVGAGATHRAYAKTMTYFEETFLTSLGLNYVNGGFVVIPALQNEVKTIADKTKLSANYWIPDNLKLDLTAGYSF